MTTATKTLLALTAALIAVTTACGTTPPDPARSQPARDTAPTDTIDAAPIGDPANDGKFQFTVTSVDTNVASLRGCCGDPVKPQGTFTVVHVTVENIGDEPQSFDSGSQAAYDGDGRRFNASVEAAIEVEDSQAFLTELNPGNTVEGLIVFDVPAGTVLTVLEAHDSLFSYGVDMALT